MDQICSWTPWTRRDFKGLLLWASCLHRHIWLVACCWTAQAHARRSNHSVLSESIFIHTHSFIHSYDRNMPCHYTPQIFLFCFSFCDSITFLNLSHTAGSWETQTVALPKEREAGVGFWGCIPSREYSDHATYTVALHGDSPAWQEASSGGPWSHLSW